MRTEEMPSSDNVEDRRGWGGGGGVLRTPRFAIGGIGGAVLLLLYVLLGGNPSSLYQGGSPSGSSPTAAQSQNEELVRRVLGDTEAVWTDLFQHQGKRYAKPHLVLFDGLVESACGQATASVGPFYCPADQRVYLDLDFFDELSQRFRAPGDFAQAYVIAHEVGHHVQNLLGISDRVAEAGRGERNAVSVRLELQADYLAGVWAHHANKKRKILEPGDIEEGIGAAAAVGDDRLQRQSRGYVVPDSFTHGSSAQRVKWFRLGFESGDPFAHDPFKEE